MNLVIVIGVALAFALGAFAIIIGIRGVDELPGQVKGDDGKFHYPWAKQLAYPTVAFFAVFGATFWFSAAVGAAATAWFVPRYRARAKADDQYQEMTEALAQWIEMLRDSIASGGGLEGPLMASAETGPEVLRPDLRELVVDMRTRDPITALRRFAHRVKHPTADLFVSAYSIAVTESTEGLIQLLTDISDKAQTELRTLRRISNGRRQTRSSVRITVLVFGAFIVLPFIFARDLITAYNSIEGQLILMLVAGLFLGGYIWLQALMTTKRPPRFFAISQEELEE